MERDDDNKKNDDIKKYIKESRRNVSYCIIEVQHLKSNSKSFIFVRCVCEQDFRCDGVVFYILIMHGEKFSLKNRESEY